MRIEPSRARTQNFKPRALLPVIHFKIHVYHFSPRYSSFLSNQRQPCSLKASLSHVLCSSKPFSLHSRDPVYSSFPSTKTRIDFAILEVGHIAGSVGGVLLLVGGLDDLVEASRAGGDKAEHCITVSLGRCL